MAHFHRSILRVLRGLTDGSYEGWIPRAEDLYRLQFEKVVYVDKDGVVSPTDGHGGPSPQAGTNFMDPSAQGMEQPNTKWDAKSGTEPILRDGFSPIDFLANSMLFPFGTSMSSKEESGWPPKLEGNGTSSLLPMELMIYNDLMTDIGGTARFSDQDFLNPPLPGSTPTPSVTMENTGPVQGNPKLGTMYG